MLRALDIRYAHPVAADSTLVVAVDRLQRAARGDLWQVAYKLFDGGGLATEAMATWMQDASVADFGMPELLLDAEAVAFAATATPQASDLGAGGAFRPQSIVQWMDDALVSARRSLGWDDDSLRVAGLAGATVLDQRFVLESGSSWSVPLSVTTIRAQVRRASVTWQQDIVDAVCTRVAASITRIAFNDWCGETASPPRHDTSLVGSWTDEAEPTSPRVRTIGQAHRVREAAEAAGQSRSPSPSHRNHREHANGAR